MGVTFGHEFIETNETAHHIDEGFEDQQHPNDTENIEEHVGKSSSSRLRISRESSNVGSNCGSNVLSHHQSYTLIDR